MNRMTFAMAAAGEKRELSSTSDNSVDELLAH